MGARLALETCDHVTDANAHIYGMGYSGRAPDGHWLRYNVVEATE